MGAGIHAGANKGKKGDGKKGKKTPTSDGADAKSADLKAAAAGVTATSDASSEKEEEKKRELLTQIALRYDLDVGDVTKTFMGNASGDAVKAQVCVPLCADVTE